MNRYLLNNFLYEMDDEIFQNLLILFCKEAQVRIEIKNKCFFNYYPQENQALQLIVEGEDNEEKGVEIVDFFVHHTSSDIWKMKIIDKIKNSDNNSYMVSNENGEGGYCIRFVNKEVLGDINEGDIVEAQVVGLALNIDIYENDEDYINNIEAGKDGSKNLLGEGQMFPLNLILNNSVDLSREEREKRNHTLDNIMTIKGTIKSANRLELNFANTKFNDYYLAIIDTAFGKLPIFFTQTMLPKGIEGFGLGNVIVADILLSGDVCISEYDKYISKKK